VKNLICLLFLIVFALTGCDGEKAAVGEGKPAPEFSVTGLSGEKIKLSDLRGKVVLLNFWASWCQPCKDEIPSLVDLDRAMAGKDFQMLAVSIEKGGNETVRDFLGKRGITLPVFFDSEGKVMRTYGVARVPETFIIDGQGIIRKKIIGPLDWSDKSVIGYLETLL
jgi:peroxiredoxin